MLGAKRLAPLAERTEGRGGGPQEPERVSVPLCSLPMAERNPFLFIATFSLGQESKAKVTC